MATAKRFVLTTPFTINPSNEFGGEKSVTELRLKAITVDFVGDTVSAHYTMHDAQGVQVNELSVGAISGAAVTAWIGNQETALLQRLGARLGATGSVSGVPDA